MVNSKPLLKNRVFGILEEQDELLKLYSSRKGVSISKLIRISVKEKMDQLMIEEEKFWMELSERKMANIYSSLKEYLDSNHLESSEYCGHGSIFSIDSEENFNYTKEFCKELQIEFSAFLSRAESDFGMGFDCECQIYEELVRRGNHEKR
jgi:hypothetical protein